MIHDIFMPALSSTMTEGKIVSWVKSPGDKVEKGETVVVVESDKADMDVESFYEGYLATILVEAGQEAPVGKAIALVAETKAEIAQAQQKAPSSSAKTSRGTSQTVASASTLEPTTTPTTAFSTNVPKTNGSRGTDGRIIASPRAKKLAKQLGVDLKTLQGSGPYGRIVAEDVERTTGKPPTVTITQTLSPTSQATPTPNTSPTPVPATSGETVPLTVLQKAVVQNMVATVQVPTYHVDYTITTDSLDKLYKIIKSKGVTMTALLAKAVAVTLQKHPLVNASYSDQGINYNRSVNVALAVAMPDGGLITPVLQNADQVDIYSLSRTWKDLVERARMKRLQPQEYKNGTITISNLGMFGVDRFDAILPPGQGAILAIGKSRPQVVATSEGLTGVKRQMTVSITCDHRVIYGAHAAAFLQDLAQLIETDVQFLTM
ncbi:MAG: dihydrolipoamide acetyltransferase family protein [cyanobacterium endosymbiont of Rhopalodia musculus]|uniref:dihydrolipoamide acetyltransferase family protein n=1 Tax=cyanobacterium endosymbiont of Epithemia clementina EcSB TaxID=3034674 RepID=UPI00247FE096|nr:dihydrolipoamide acetyltransferase family protein [cyanobacterium endosymbiont of Epithemia clementina EcSB]WGT67920.1 dihydrolipoamide acetyltransferase family protein [cyanobacterium endosymbiont of Epithemia clementina EcSB]